MNAPTATSAIFLAMSSTLRVLVLVAFRDHGQCTTLGCGALAAQRAFIVRFPFACPTWVRSRRFSASLFT